MQGTDNRHSDVGADWLAQWFGAGVTEPVRLHVAASPYAQAACRLRRWDDAAKDPGAQPPPFEHYRLLLAGLAQKG